MQRITLRVISGADRGHVFSELETPITIGREEGNSVQLNDERISRYHVKVQEDDGRLVVTDLDSTNGTRVNGHTCSLKILRFGDTISIGRTVLLVGSKDQVQEWLADGSSSADSAGEDDSRSDRDPSTGLAQDHSPPLAGSEARIPRKLSAGQAAELRELLDHVHEGLSRAVVSAETDEADLKVRINQRDWQILLMTQSELSELIHQIEDPNSDDLSGQEI